MDRGGTLALMVQIYLMVETPESGLLESKRR